MEYGAHLPLLSFQGESRMLDNLNVFTETARDAGYQFLCSNDHLVFSRPWLDGPTALASVLSVSGDMTLATTICLPVVRGPGPVAKTLAALDVLSGGRLVVGLGPGSSARDYALAGLDYAERWQRFDESIETIRAFFQGRDFVGDFYSTCKERLEPRPAQEAGPPIWLGSWGAKGGLRRTAEMADGWLASGYNTTPERFAESLAQVVERLREVGKDPATFSNGIATMWTYVTDDKAKARSVLEGVLAPMLKRPIDELETKLPIGSPEHCAERLRPYQDAGAQRIFIWPIADEIEQLENFMAKVVPLIEQD